MSYARPFLFRQVVVVFVLICGMGYSRSAQPADVKNPSLEAAELMKAAETLEAQKKFEEAIKVLEPLAAMYPEDRTIQLPLMRQFWNSAGQILAGPKGVEFHSIEETQKVELEKVMLALERMRRAVEIRKASFQTVKRLNPTVAAYESERMAIWRSDNPAASAFIRLGYLTSPTAELRKAISDVRTGYQADVTERIEFLAKLVEREPSQFPYFTRMVSQATGKPGESVRESELKFRLWLEVRSKVGEVPHSSQDIGQQNIFLDGVIRRLVYKPMGTRPDDEADDRAKVAHDIFELLGKQSHPGLQNYGRIGHAWRQLKFDETTFEQFSGEFDAIRESLEKNIQDAPIETARLIRREMYGIWVTGITMHGSSDLGRNSAAFQEWQEKEAVALVDFQLSRKECTSQAVSAMMNAAVFRIARMLPPVKSYDRLKRMVSLVDDPECQIYDEESTVKYRRTDWQRRLESWLARFPELKNET